jgi:hypothetical protein
MSSKRYEGANQAERDFIEALERLEKGMPRHQRLKALAAKGALRVTISSVALEAGRSRTLIGTANCAYPGIRNRILDERQPTTQRRTQDDIIARLRRDNQALKAENARIATQLADAVAAAWRIKKELDFQKELQKRSHHRGSKVVPFERSGG